MPTIPLEAGQSTLSFEDINSRLKNLRYSWQVIDGQKLEYVFDFHTFSQALHFVHAVGHLAQQYNHHPDIQLLYTKVIIDLWTHSVSGISEKDFGLAKYIEALYGSSMNNELQHKLEQVKQDAKNLGQHVSEVISSGGGEALKEKVTTAMETVNTQTKKVDQMARENTWVTAGIAALVGMVLGVLFSSKHRRS